MALYSQQGNSFFVTNEKNVNLVDTLPVATYTVKRMPTGEYYLEQIESFEHNGKIYGDAMSRVERILNTFNDRPATTGVIMSGEKGSGKTLLAKLIAQHSGLPVIVINSPHAGETFNQFVQTMSQPMVILFDEFEKVYDEETQPAILTLLDGTYSSKKLFLVTCNDRYKVNNFMFNRPGRFFYSFKYRGLDPSFVKEYAEDVLIDKNKVNGVVRFSNITATLNFDMLKAIIEEMNRYDEDVVEVLKFINVDVEDRGSHYKVSKFVPKKDSSIKLFDDNVSRGMHVRALGGFYIVLESKDEDGDQDVISFDVNNIVRYDDSGQIIIAENEDAYIEITKVVHEGKSWHDYL